MSVAKRILVIVSAFIILVSTTGVSLVTHTCSMSANTNTRIFPEFFGNTIKCCKSDNSTPVSSSNNSLEKANCCKNLFSLIKTPSFFNNAVSKILAVKLFVNLPFQVGNNLTAPESVTQGNFSEDWSPPPLHYGKVLLHFIRQIKIHLLY